MIKTIVCTLITIAIIIFNIESVFADSSPVPLSPTNGSTITQTSPKLSWEYSGQCYTNGSCFYVEVDDSDTFTSIDKYIYTNNKYYTPQNLAYKKWFWHVKAKNPSGTWGAMSDTWSFTIAASSNSPTPSSTPTSTPTSFPVSSSSTNSSSFSTSNIPSQINSDQSFTVSVTLSLPDSPNVNFFLKGAFKKSDGSNYFGQTLVSGNWIKNGSSYSNQYQITTDSSGNWSGNMEVKPDPDDSGFSGTDDYTFKVGRYTLAGLGPTWSNESGIKIVGSSTNSTSQTSSTTTKSSGSITKSSSTSISPSSKSIIYSSNSNPKLNYQIASVAGASASATPSSTVEVKNEKRFNFLLWIGGGLILTGLGSLVYIYLRSRKII